MCPNRRAWAEVLKTARMRTLFSWYLLLVSLTMVLRYLIGIPPRCERDWRYIRVAVAFLTWLLRGFGSARS